jgi:hypothetical protein
MGWRENKIAKEKKEKKASTQNSSRWFHNAKKEKYHYLQLAVILTNVL